MKRAFNLIGAAAIGLALMTSPGLAAEFSYSGFLGDYYKNLQPGPEGGVKMRWLKPGVDFSKYKKLMIDSVTFFFADDSEYKGIDPQLMKELADSFNLELLNTLKGTIPIVADPGPDVVRIRFAITGVKASRPVMSATSSIIPVGIALSLVRKGVAGSWSGSGATSAELMVVDTVTDEVIAVAVDERTAGYTERFSKWGSAQEAFKFWAGRVKAFIEDSRKAQKE